MPQVRFFNLGGSPTVIAGSVGFTEGGLVHAVRSMAPLSHKYDVTVVCPNVPSLQDSIREVSIDGVRVICPKPPLPVRGLPASEMCVVERPLLTLLNWPSILAGYLAESKRLSRERVDVVISNGIVASYLAGLMRGPWCRIAVLHHLYLDRWSTGGASSPGGLLVGMERLLLRHLNADAVAVVNPFVASCLAAKGFPADRVWFVGNGVDTGRLKFTLRHDQDSLLFVGRLRAAKGVESLLEAFAIIHARRPRALLHIVGDGLLRRALESRATVLGIDGSVVFHGFVDEETKTRLLQSCSVYLSASRFEGFGLPVVEAMAAGAVPVVSDIPAHRYVFQDRPVGCLTASADEMAASVLELLQDEPRRTAMATAGRALVEDMWTWNRVAERYGMLIDRLLARRDATAEAPPPQRPALK
jgi:glycosyltransferase involved in cell wall biosynthesis